MARWNNFFLQKMGTDGMGEPYPVMESVSRFGVWCKDIPFKLLENVKEPARRSWPDEHGDDEYIPSGGLFLESYEMEVEFGCKLLTAPVGDVEVRYVDDVRKSVADFLEYLRSSGMMKLYSSHTRIGRQLVRLSLVDGSSTWVTDGDGKEFLVFKVKFKVNDPVTDVKLEVAGQ